MTEILSPEVNRPQTMYFGELGHFLFFRYCPKRCRISENVRTISENVRTFHLSEPKMIFSLLIFYPKIVFINFLIQVFIRFSFDTVLFTVFYPTLSKTGVGYYMEYPTPVSDRVG